MSERDASRQRRRPLTLPPLFETRREVLAEPVYDRHSQLTQEPAVSTGQDPMTDLLDGYSL